ncbi:serine hydrolase FSH [Halenospora varia]|nr:serine hydrolase FSH [Halenospora varia]
MVSFTHLIVYNLVCEYLLMLNIGYGQSASLLDIKTRPIQEQLKRIVAVQTPWIEDIQFCFPEAPFRILPAELSRSWDDDSVMLHNNSADIDAWTWSRAVTSGTRTFFDDSTIILDITIGLEVIAQTIETQGPFDGLIGFSSGASLVVLVASLLENGRKHAFDKLNSIGKGIRYPRCFLKYNKSTAILECLQMPMKFVVCCSSFSLTHEDYTSFYKPKINTPILHVIGRWDTIVSEEQSLELAKKCQGKSRLLYHMGSHFVPRQRHVVFEIIKFVIECCEIVTS